jgi:hypothetical protein
MSDTNTPISIAIKHGFINENMSQNQNIQNGDILFALPLENAEGSGILYAKLNGNLIPFGPELGYRGKAGSLSIFSEKGKTTISPLSENDITFYLPSLTSEGYAIWGQ